MIYITGDTHGLTDVQKLKDDSYIKAGDYLIIAGDVAVCWSEKFDKETVRYWEKKPYTVLFVDGNHENFTKLLSYPIEEWNGGKVHFIAPNLIHLMRGQVFTIEGKTFFTFGGGISIDKAYRRPFISWWPDEEPTAAECEEGLANLDKVNWKVDYVVTHAAPEWIVRGPISQIHPMLQEDCECEKYLDTIYDKLDFKMWFCGHYHLDAMLTRYKMLELYQDVVRIDKGYPIVNAGWSEQK